MILAPIVLFTYNRPNHTVRTIDALLSNKMASHSDLIVYSDGPRNMSEENNVTNIREMLKKVTGFRSIEIKHQKHNKGLAKSIVNGIGEVLTKYDRVIVLEDDLVTSKYFLEYMNEGLNRYEADDRVASIHGYVYPVASPLPEAFFLKGADCWGWATWRRAWSLYNENSILLLQELKNQNLQKKFDFDGAYPFTKMLEDQSLGKNDSWAIRWHASIYLANKLTLYPGRSLVKNIGLDLTGVHCQTDDTFDAELTDLQISLVNLKVEHSEYAWRAFKNFYKHAKKKSLITASKKIKNNIKYVLPSIITKVISKFRRSQINAFTLCTSNQWNEARSVATGYDADLILEKVLESTLRVKNGEALFERDSILFRMNEYSWPLLSGIMMAAANNGGNLSVLDFGGSLGSTYFQYKDLLKDVKKVAWNIIEQPKFVEAGNTYLSEVPGLNFYKSIEECFTYNKINLIILSSSIQYIEDPYLILNKLINSNAKYLILDRTPFSNFLEDRLAIQTVPKQIYEASYPMWILSKSKFNQWVDSEFHIVSEFQVPPELQGLGKDQNFQFTGVILKRRVC